MFRILKKTMIKKSYKAFKYYSPKLMNIFRLHYSLKGTFKDIILLNFHIATKEKVLLELFYR